MGEVEFTAGKEKSFPVFYFAGAGFKPAPAMIAERFLFYALFTYWEEIPIYCHRKILPLSGVFFTPVSLAHCFIGAYVRTPG
ncbi:MAG: hypothetical protein HZB29_13740 [Nitrospinae bacterium]|nr:hypothetical protein [Nitrospinota bacterium]